MLDMSVWLSIYTMCFLPRSEAPEDATLLFAFDVQPDRPTLGKLVGVLSMCRTVAPAKQAAYKALTIGKIAEAVADDRAVASRMLFDTVVARLRGAGEALVVAALATVLRARKPTHGAYAVAVSSIGGKLFERLGFTRLASSAFTAPKGVYYLAKADIDVAAFIAGRVPAKMIAAVCTRRGVRDPTQVIARC
jgi:hypothetical protein